MEEGSGMRLDGCWIDKVGVSGGRAHSNNGHNGPKAKPQMGRESESSENKVTATQVQPLPIHTHTHKREQGPAVGPYGDPQILD